MDTFYDKISLNEYGLSFADWVDRSSSLSRSTIQTSNFLNLALSKTKDVFDVLREELKITGDGPSSLLQNNKSFMRVWSYLQFVACTSVVSNDRSVRYALCFSSCG